MKPDDPSLASTRKVVSEEPADLYGAQLAAGATAGDWIVGALVNQGGFASIYRAEHVVTKRPAALKVLHRSLAESATVLRRFRREAEAVNRLRHPNIVEIFEA